jgi:hypothetical protein
VFNPHRQHHQRAQTSAQERTRGHGGATALSRYIYGPVASFGHLQTDGHCASPIILDLPYPLHLGH